MTRLTASVVFVLSAFAVYAIYPLREWAAGYPVHPLPTAAVVPCQFAWQLCTRLVSRAPESAFDWVIVSVLMVMGAWIVLGWIVTAWNDR